MTFDPNDYPLLPAELAAVMVGVPTMPPVTAESVRAIREHARVASARQTRSEVHRVEGRTLPGPDGGVPVRVYTPSPATPLPVLVFGHGGGWCMCDIDTHDALCREIANRAEVLVVSVDYRLAPENPYPAGLEDFYAAASWVAEHAADIGGDPTRVAVGGDSAGANLATVTCLAARDRGGPTFRHQLLAYPGLDAVSQRASWTEMAHAPMVSAETARSMWAAYTAGHDPRDPYLSPVHASDLSGLPPAIIVAPGYDHGRDDFEAYAVALAKAGVEVDFRPYPGMLHGFLSYFAAVPACSRALDEVCAALRKALTTD
ncbi:alpha/beta hydrolase (plasmid) [Embleya sp. NBC_00888]|uniref:alpha/beta hydrolase n=1 Tax=Embleya sp. NBC_00888 TaxID=2975960 RepID=UPI002F90E7BD|nr:alpha/beta hydrolase [Embleya sp. NBC_00888]